MMMMTLHDRIYEAVFFPDLWTDILHDLARAVKAEGAVLVNVSQPKSDWIASNGVHDLYDAFFREGWAYDNAKTKALLGIPHQGFISDAEHFSDDWMAEQPIYREFYWKHGFGYAAGTVIEAPSGDMIALSIEKKKGLEPVGRKEIDFLDTLRPHLARAAVLASRFEFARIEAAVQALQATNLPAAMIAADGRTIACNGLFEAFSAQIAVEARDRIRFQHRPANSFFDAVLARNGASASDRGASKAGGSHSFPIPAAGGRPPAVIHLIPIVGSGRDIFLRAAYILVATPLDRQAAPSASVIKGLFDLTPAEARIAACLVGGLTVNATAAQQGLSVETVRTHVKSLLSKSGTHRQADFLGMMSSFRAL
jgi:DNA-binding CsgD family transcriptional regulator